MALNFPVLPQNNLPDAAVPWGRRTQNSLEEIARTASDLNSRNRMMNRAQAGQLGTLGRQIQELQHRSVEIIPIPDVSVAITSNQPYRYASVNFTVPGVPGGTRWAIIAVSTFADAGDPGNTSMGASLLDSGQVLDRGMIDGVDSPQFNWSTPYLNLHSMVQVPSEGLTVTFQIAAASFSGSRTVGVYGAEATVMFSDLV